MRVTKSDLIESINASALSVNMVFLSGLRGRPKVRSEGIQVVQGGEAKNRRGPYHKAGMRL